MTTGSNQQDAEDAVQEALLRAAGRWQSIIDKGDPNAYVRRAAINASRDRWRLRRRQPREVALTDALNESNPANAPQETAAELRALRDALAELPRSHRVAVVAR